MYVLDHMHTFLIVRWIEKIPLKLKHVRRILFKALQLRNPSTV